MATSTIINGTSLAISKQPRGLTISCRAATTSVDMRGTTRTNLYKVLSLESETAATAGEIKEAYRRMARQCHPDVCPRSRREESTRIFLELRRAYETLSDPVLRRRHDREMREGVVPSEFSREVWEDQLMVLRKRSEEKKKKKKAAGLWRVDVDYL